jgi:hypothetical protein
MILQDLPAMIRTLISYLYIAAATLRSAWRAQSDSAY